MTHYAISIVYDLARMQRHPQPYLVSGSAGAVVNGERRRNMVREPCTKPALRNFRRHHDQDSISAVLDGAASPIDPGKPESIHDRPIHAFPYHQQMGIGAGRIAEPFYIYRHDLITRWTAA